MRTLSGVNKNGFHLHKHQINTKQAPESAPDFPCQTTRSNAVLRRSAPLFYRTLVRPFPCSVNGTECAPLNHLPSGQNAHSGHYSRRTAMLLRSPASNGRVNQNQLCPYHSSFVLYRSLRELPKKLQNFLVRRPLVPELIDDCLLQRQIILFDNLRCRSGFVHIFSLHAVKIFLAAIAGFPPPISRPAATCSLTTAPTADNPVR